MSVILPKEAATEFGEQQFWDSFFVEVRA